MNNLDRELQSLGFVSDPKREPMSFAYLKPPKKRSKTKRARTAPSMTPAAIYARGVRARWAARGIYTPRKGNVAVPAVSTTTQESVPTVPQTEAATLPLIQRAA